MSVFIESYPRIGYTTALNSHRFGRRKQVVIKTHIRCIGLPNKTELGHFVKYAESRYYYSDATRRSPLVIHILIHVIEIVTVRTRVRAHVFSYFPGVGYSG